MSEKEDIPEGFFIGAMSRTPVSDYSDVHEPEADDSSGSCSDSSVIYQNKDVCVLHPGDSANGPPTGRTNSDSPCPADAGGPGAGRPVSLTGSRPP